MLPPMLITNEDVESLRVRCLEALGSPTDWAAPVGYPDSLALCVIDSIWSIGIRYATVDRVVDSYRARRNGRGGDADTDGAEELLADVDAAGGAEAWRKQVGTRHRTSTRGGIPKAEAVVLAAQALVGAGLLSAADVRGASVQQLEQAEWAWRAVRGQRSGISWRYLLLLAGSAQVKPDRMICRFCERAIGRRPTPDYAAELVVAVAAKLGVHVRALDHRMWRFQSGRG